MKTMVKAQRYNNCYGQKHITRAWSDLPIDVLNLIVGKLPSIFDQISFRSVCKSWHLARGIQITRNLPWLIAHRWEFANIGNDWKYQSSCKFHIPVRNEFQTHTSTKILEGQERWIHGAGICASKYGWLLLQKSQQPFFYNPFSKKMIKLPRMNINFNRATFSLSPTSADCVCFAIQSSKDSEMISISICSAGDAEWCTIVVNGFRRVIEDVVYSDGIFYCVFSGGILGAFYVAHFDWSILTDREPVSHFSLWSRAQLIESNGELLLVCRREDFTIFRFDWLEMDWVMMHELGNLALFLGCTSFSVPADGETSYLAGRIYYHGSSCTCYYSMQSGKSSICSELYPWVVEYTRERVWVEAPQS